MAEENSPPPMNLGPLFAALALKGKGERQSFRHRYYTRSLNAIAARQPVLITARSRR
jgi:hypothetical protein